MDRGYARVMCIASPFIFFVSDNKSCLYGYDVPGTSIYQKGHWTGIPGSDPAILYLYVLDWISFRHKNSTSVFYLEWD